MSWWCRRRCRKRGDLNVVYKVDGILRRHPVGYHDGHAVGDDVVYLTAEEGEGGIGGNLLYASEAPGLVGGKIV